MIATRSQMGYLQTLWTERFGDTPLPDHLQRGANPDGATVSAWIQRCLETDGALKATREQKDRVLMLAAQLGLTVTPRETSAGCNRQARALDRQLRRSLYIRGAADFDAFVASLEAPAESTSTPPAA